MKLRVLMTTLLFFVLAEGMFYFVLPIQLELLTNSTLIVGVFMALPPLASFLSTETAGDVSDRVGRRLVMMFGISLSLVIYSVIFISNNILLIALLLVLYGLRDSLFYTPLEARVMEITPRGREGEYNGLLWFPFEFGYAISTIFAALLLSKGFKSVYFSASVFTALSLLVLVLMVKKQRPKRLTIPRLLEVTKRSFTAFPSHLAHCKQLSRTEKLMFFFSFISSVSGSVVWIVIPLLTALENLPVIDAALLMFAYSIPSAFSDIIGGGVFDRWRSRLFFFLSFAVSTAAFAHFGLGGGLASLPLFFVASLLSSAMWIGIIATVSSLHKKHRGGHAGLFFTADYLGSSVGALLTGILSSFSIMWPVYAGAVLSGVGALLALTLRDEELSATQI